MRDVDDRAAMNLPEAVGIELLRQILERGADERFAFRRKDAGVLVIGLEIAHFVDRNQPDLIANRRANPRQA